jgi:hypothetical protein
MDASLPGPELARIEDVLAKYRAQGLQFHALRTRQAGTRAFVTLHVLVPGAWTFSRRTTGRSGSKRTCAKRCRGARDDALEPNEDPVSHLDQELDRPPV